MRKRVIANDVTGENIKGHYIWGAFYMPAIAIPSVASAAFTSKWSGMKHKERWFEVNASKLGGGIL